MPTPLPHNTTPRLSLGRSPVNDALVEFFAHAKGSSRVLRVLAGKTRPIGCETPAATGETPMLPIRSTSHAEMAEALRL
jgi:hypothetical protein